MRKPHWSKNMSAADRAAYNEYMRVYMAERYRKQRAVAIQMLGGKCVECGTTENLEIDHIERSTKAFDVGHAWSAKLEKYFGEIEKCQLLCKRHHIEKTSKELSVEHGGGLSGKGRCKCSPCKQRKAERSAEWRRRNPRVPTGRPRGQAMHGLLLPRDCVCGRKFETARQYGGHRAYCKE